MEFEKAILALCDAGVDFLVIGGFAASLHGSAYVTNDLDIFYSRSALNLRKIKDALAPFHPRPRGFPPEAPFVWDEATLRNSSILTLKTTFGDLDLLAEVAGLGDFASVRARAKIVSVFGRDVPVLDKRSLIDAKRAAGRTKDLLTIPELESLLEAEELALASRDAPDSSDKTESN